MKRHKDVLGEHATLRDAIDYHKNNCSQQIKDFFANDPKAFQPGNETSLVNPDKAERIARRFAVSRNVDNSFYGENEK